jgi:hypothetical protein
MVIFKARRDEEDEEDNEDNEDKGEFLHLPQYSLSRKASREGYALYPHLPLLPYSCLGRF